MIKVSIIWLDTKIVGIVLGEKSVYIANDYLPEDGNYMEITVELPLVQATKFCTYISQGITIEKLEDILKQVKERIAELLILEKRNMEIDTNIDLENW